MTMSAPTPAGDAPLSRLLDEVCDRFEAAWKAADTSAAEPPRIEDYLADVPGPQRFTLLCELVLLEGDYRRRSGESPRALEFLARFPELDAAWLAGALAPGTTPVPPRGDRTAERAPAQQTTPPRACEDGEAQSVPATVGGYRVVRPLGGGGMGTVYEAEEIATGRRVALKLLAPELADSPEAIARFRAEGRLASGIAHPRCVFVLAADEEAGRPYIVMELMPGDTLTDLVRRQGPLRPDQAVAYTLDVLDGLLAAHRAGILHRDVKPSNCFLTADGRVKVGDFGLAKSLAGGAHLTRTGTFLGTPLYASPEQIKGQPVDPRTDVYSLAATLYYLLAGKAPFEGGDALAVMAQAVSERPPPLRGLRPDVPPGLERVLLRGLERDRERRPQSLDEFRAALVPFAPQRYYAGTPAWRFVAHLLDGFLYTLLGSDIGLFALFFLGEDAEGKRTLLVVSNILWVLAFALLEGLWGWSPGKLLLGLRVSTAGDSGPPGVARALVRTLAHFASVYLAATALLWVVYGNPELWWAELANPLMLLCGSLLLLCTMRRRNGYRGPHELVSGTRVMQLPRPGAASFEFQSVDFRLQTSNLHSEIHALKSLGPFTVQGVLCETPSQKVLVGTDPALGRTVWLELRGRGGAGLSPARRDLHRPARLRWLGAGVHGPWQWDAFLAPPGVPAADVFAHGRRLEWHQARPVLEQLADELGEARADGTLPPVLTVEQVWLRPDGQVLLLDAPPGEPDSTPANALPGMGEEQSLALLRQTAVLLLDRDEKPSFAPLGPIRRACLRVVVLGLLGAAAWSFFQENMLMAGGLLVSAILPAFWLMMALRAQSARDRRGLVRSPLPGHADALLQRLLGRGRPYATVAEVRADLEATRDRPAQVTATLRLAHLVFLGSLLSPGLFLMCYLGKCFNAMAITVLQEEVADQEKALHVLDSGRLGDFVRDRPDRDAIVERLSRPVVRSRLADALGRQKEDLRLRLEAVNVVERLWHGEDLKRARELLESGRAVDLASFGPEQLLGVVDDAEAKARRPERFRSYKGSDREGAPLVWVLMVVLAGCPLGWVAWAWLWRGGLSLRILGLTLVSANGHPAWRLQCAWRALVVWLPVTVLLGLSLSLDASHPELARWSWASWGGALLVLAGFAVLALRSPARGLHDRLAGTYVVPR
jgi:hypothetical protein